MPCRSRCPPVSSRKVVALVSTALIASDVSGIGGGPWSLWALALRKINGSLNSVLKANLSGACMAWLPVFQSSGHVLVEHVPQFWEFSSVSALHTVKLRQSISFLRSSSSLTQLGRFVLLFQIVPLL